MMTTNHQEPKNKIKIMVVEDELIVARNIENQLRKIGYEVLAVIDSGPEAVSRTAELKPDLVLMDIKLAGEMDGVTAAQQIHDRFRIPVVYLTAYADNETLERAKRTGPYGYIIKPFEPKKLHTTIEVALYKHHMEEKLRDSELRFRTLANSSPVGIFQTDINGDCIYVNTRWCEIAGFSQELAMGQGWAQGLHPEDRETIFNAWNQMVKSGEEFTQEYRFQTPSGKITWVFGHASPLKSESGERTGYIGTITDITLRKKLEDELLTSKKLESLGILAGGIAHDFNNLLSVILGNMSMLRDEPNITPDQRSMLKSAEKAAAQAAELAQKLITFSKGGWLERKKIIFPQLLKDIIKNHFSFKEDLFDITISPQLWPIDGDQNQLKQVFTNIINNAVEAGEEMKDAGIKIMAENVEINGEEHPLKKGQYVKITVKDRGIGIPQEHIGKVFDPYFTTKAMGAKRGLGLGLTICYSIIQKHEGNIQVTSEPGQGTSTAVYLPVFRESRHNDVSHRKPHPPPKLDKALVMDDEAVIKDVTRQMLMRLGYQVETFDEGSQVIEAVEKAEKAGKPFEVVFLDLINKKGLGGKETLKRLIQLVPHVKIIAISGFSDGSEQDALKKLGFCEVLFKPFKLEDLKKIVEKIR